MGKRSPQTSGIGSENAPNHSNGRPVGGQAAIGLFGIRDYDYRAVAAEAKAATRQEGVVSEREAARRETAGRLREFREALNAKLAAAQVQEAPPQAPVEAAPERQLFGIARAVAEIPRDPKAARDAVCQAVAKRDRERQALLAAKYPATKRPPAPAQPNYTPRQASAFSDEAAAEYEAHLAEVAEARSRQLDDEADRYACTFAGAGYTEYLMAIEG